MTTLSDLLCPAWNVSWVQQSFAAMGQMGQWWQYQVLLPVAK